MIACRRHPSSSARLGDMAPRFQPGSYRFRPNRSSIYLPMTNFPKNTEVESS
jgi:hypothetical protein